MNYAAAVLLLLGPAISISSPNDSCTNREHVACWQSGFQHNTQLLPAAPSPGALMRCLQVLGGRVEALAEAWEMQQQYGGASQRAETGES